MSAITVTELIDRAAIAADMHDNFVTNPAWLYWANVEVKELIARVARLGFPFNLSSQTITTDGSLVYYIVDPLAIVGVYRIKSDGNFIKLMYRSPLDKMSFTEKGNATSWTMKYSASLNPILQFYPSPQEGDDDIIVDVITNPDTLYLNSTLYLPLNWEERVVLGMARRALTREETTNGGIERQIAEIDSHIESTAYDYVMSQNNVVSRVKDKTDWRNQGFIYL